MRISDWSSDVCSSDLDQGKLTLDDAIARYVPGITQGDQITVRQLLSHTSGLQDYWPQDYSFAAMEHPITPQQIVDRWAKKPLDFPPGTQWQYSNRSEEHTSELQSLMHITYAVFCLKKKTR